MSQMVWGSVAGEPASWHVPATTGAGGMVLHALALTPQVEGAIGPPGIDFLALAAGDTIVLGYSFVTARWNGSNPTLNTESDDHAWYQSGLQPEPAAVKAAMGDYLFGGAPPLMWLAPDTVRVYVDDGAGGNPGSTVGSLTILVALLPPQAA